MPAYITAEFTPKNKEMLQSYSAKAAYTIAPFDGEFLVNAPIETLGKKGNDGKTHYQYKAIIVFPSKELAQNWFSSPEYQSLIEIRDQAMDSNFSLIG